MAVSFAFSKSFCLDLKKYNLKLKKYAECGADFARNRWISSRKNVLIADLDDIFEFNTLEERELLQNILLSMEGNPADSIKRIIDLYKTIIKYR